MIYHVYHILCIYEYIPTDDDGEIDELITDLVLSDEEDDSFQNIT